MKLATALASIVLAAFAVPAAQAQSDMFNKDPNAIPQGPAGTSRADPHSGAQSAYEQARADCRKVKGKAKQDCVAQAQRNYDREQREKQTMDSVSKKAATPVPVDVTKSATAAPQDLSKPAPTAPTDLSKPATTPPPQ